MLGISPLIRREFSVDQASANLYPCLPKDMLIFVLSHLSKFKDLCNFNQTCTNLYAIRNEDGLWGMLFKRCFPHLAHVVPQQGWLELCQREYLGIRNVIQEKYALQSFAIEGAKISCLTLTDDGHIIIGSEDGLIRVFDPMTGKSVLLGDCFKTDRPFSLDCKGRFLIITHLDGFSVFDLKTKKEISIPYEKQGFNQEGLYGATLSHEGQLFARLSDKTTGKHAIWVWDLEQPEEAPWGCALSRSPLHLEFCGRVLVITMTLDSEIGVLDLDTKQYQTFLGSDRSFSIHDYSIFIEASLFGENHFCSRKKVGENNPIFIWDLKGSQLDRSELPIPSKVISLADNDHLFHVTWDAIATPQDSWIENINKPLEEAPLCSFPELSLLFQKYVFQSSAFLLRWKYDIWSKMDTAIIPRVRPQWRVFRGAKLFSPTADLTGLWCFNFAASDQEILEDIAKELEDKNNSPLELHMAKERLERMSKPIQEAINQRVPEETLQIFRQYEHDLMGGYAEIPYFNAFLPVAAAIRKYLEETKAK
jgi:hypothetical protein